MLSNRYLVKSVSSRNFRLFSSAARSFGVWGDFSKRPSSLKLGDSKIQKDLLNGIDQRAGPASIEDSQRKLAYHSPVHIDETFKLAYKFLEKDSEKYYKEIEGLEKKLSNTSEESDIKVIKDEIDELLIKAELDNPEVLYNTEFLQETIDRSQPIYRKFLKEKWESYDLMITMQRLEQLHVIPDTLPTLDPKVDVKIKFPHNTQSEFAKWVTPGDTLPCFAVAKPPTIQIQEFERIDRDQLYSILIINPDTPDLSTNSFKTTLHYGLANVPLNNVNNTINTKTLLENSDRYTFKDYEPLFPEKNAQIQRACLWVFRQSKELSIDGELSSDNFDIRSFVHESCLVPVGAHVWRQHFDRSTNKIRSEYGFEKGRVFHRVRRPHPIIE